MGSSSHRAKQPLQEQQISFGMMHHNPSSSSSSSLHASFMSKESGGNYDLGSELDQALYMYLDGQNSTSQEQRQTLNIFPSQPMHLHPAPNKVEIGMLNSITSGSNKRSREGTSMELANPRTDGLTEPGKDAKGVKEVNNKRGLSTSDGPRTTDAKTLRRLAQNREAARKSRLRKKAYIQQLESSRIKLAQLEQELQRVRNQGMCFGGGALVNEQGIPVGLDNMSSEAAMFDMEYARWLEEHHRLMCELRSAVQQHIPDNELQMFVANCVAHYDEMTGIRSLAAKTDVFHLISGIWMTPAERCFMWLGGFRPSDIIKMLLHHMEPLTDQQLLAVCGLQQSTQETEEALSQGLEALNQSLSDTIASDALSCPSNMANYMGQMAIAMNKLANLEGFVRQADNLRHQTLHRLNQLLTSRQMARCLLAIAEYFHRLRALSSLWLTRPRQE
ncbi:transcription factor HBP-1b(c38)-like protein [Carex littledalei]|uniref:Transcription factor HBP-1b(C38)-like protein n=1 Tax=Carex littledalei TaxID=544730 RepID=A0A833R2S9_9POAL|nr:transcription factor HBP-1b(c38)-like protein [Carex littledalei]